MFFCAFALRSGPKTWEQPLLLRTLWLFKKCSHAKLSRKVAQRPSTGPFCFHPLNSLICKAWVQSCKGLFRQSIAHGNLCPGSYGNLKDKLDPTTWMSHFCGFVHFLWYVHSLRGSLHKVREWGCLTIYHKNHNCDLVYICPDISPMLSVYILIYLTTLLLQPRSKCQIKSSFVQSEPSGITRCI